MSSSNLPQPFRGKRWRSGLLAAAGRRRPFQPSCHTLMSCPFFILLVISILAASADAVFVHFDNCLPLDYQNSDIVRLQFRPYYVSANFNTSAPSHNLKVTVFGNVQGQSTVGSYPSPDDPKWSDPTDRFGKIFNVSASGDKLSTLFYSSKVLSYSPYDDKREFCQTLVNASCPLGPIFNANTSDPYALHAFTITHDFWSTYSFATLATRIRVQDGDGGNNAPFISCVSTSITPDLGSTLSYALSFVPAAILALVAVATVLAATFSPWGSLDPFRWTSNYGRDEDLLRLVTPGFGDCLQYLQFIVLAGSLNLSYPGFYQPIVSRASWSALMFNQSFVSGGDGYQSIVDGIYITNGTYGLSRLSQLVGITEDQDIWAGMAIWLLVVTVGVTLFCQLGFFVRWLYLRATDTQEQDRRSKNWPFTVGNVVRIVFNYLQLPIISLSMFQLVVAPDSPAVVVAMAVVLLAGILGSATWIFWFIFTTRPRAFLFDDLPTVLTYGPLYNTYSDDAAPFAFIPVLLTFIRGVAIGAVQPSGIAQLILLAICEVILVLTLHAFRPFQSSTSMNAYQTFFATIRFATTMLSVAFVPSLNVGEGVKGWIGYVMLLLHAIVLVFGFFLNAVQTLLEVVARLLGAGADARGGLSKVFGMRQLSRRAHRKVLRSSMNSDATMLTHDMDAKSQRLSGGRSRSMSASSAILLNQQGSGSQRASTGFDQYSQGGATSPTPGTPGGAATPFSYLASGAGSSIGTSSRRPTMGSTLESPHPYYRPPRARRPTIEQPLPPGARSRDSYASSDVANTLYHNIPDQADGDPLEGPSFSPNRNSITPAYLRTLRDDSDPNLERRKNTDYTVRESDFYYGVRGPALNSLPTRKLKTGPADPVGPVSSATGFFKTLFGGKRKEKGKGFEVVRSMRAPPPMVPLDEEEPTSPVQHEPYKDSPEVSAVDASDAEHKRSHDGGRRGRSLSISSLGDGDFEYLQGPSTHVSEIPPSLAPIETGGGIELPSRVGSRSSTAVPNIERAPTIPRKSSRRTSSADPMRLDAPRLSTVVATPPGTPGQAATLSQHHLQPSPMRLPFESSEPSPSPERSPGHSTASSIFAAGESSVNRGEHQGPPQMASHNERPMSTGYVHQHLASESIQPGIYDPSAHLGSAAELVDGTRRSLSTGGSTKHSR